MINGKKRANEEPLYLVGFCGTLHTSGELKYTCVRKSGRKSCKLKNKSVTGLSFEALSASL